MKKILLGINILFMLGSMEVSASMPSVFGGLAHSAPQVGTARPDLTPEQATTAERVRTLIQEKLQHDGSLNLEYCNIGDEGAIALADALRINTSITEVNLENNRIGAEGTRALANFLISSSAVTHINLSFNYLGADGVKELADAIQNKHFTTFVSIGLAGNNMGDFGAKALIDAIKNNLSTTGNVYIWITNNNIGDTLEKELYDIAEARQAAFFAF